MVACPNHFYYVSCLLAVGYFGRPPYINIDTVSETTRLTFWEVYVLMIFYQIWVKSPFPPLPPDLDPKMSRLRCDYLHFPLPTFPPPPSPLSLPGHGSPSLPGKIINRFMSNGCLCHWDQIRNFLHRSLFSTLKIFFHFEHIFQKNPFVSETGYQCL